MRRHWLLLVLLFLTACTGSNPAATQTRAIELSQLTRVAATVTTIAGTPTGVPGTLAAQATAPTGPARTTPVPTARAAPTLTATRPPPARPGIPAFTDLVLDEAHNRPFGTDQPGGKVFVLGLPGLKTIAIIDVGQGAQPAGLAYSPEGAELAVALYGRGGVALIDTTSLTIVGWLLPKITVGDPHPWSVVYVQPGRLYAIGSNSGSAPLHVFDTATRTDIGRTPPTDTFGGRARMVLAEDGSLYIGLVTSSPHELLRYTIGDPVPTRAARGQFGAFLVPDVATRRDGTAVYTSGGQVWSNNLQSQLGAFSATGTRIDYAPATERLYICQAGGLAEVEATGNYNTVATYVLSARPRVARASADGGSVYVSTDAGIDVIRPGANALAPVPSTPQPTATLAPQNTTIRPTPTVDPRSLPTKPGVPAFADLALDEGRNRLYGTDQVGGKLLVFALPNLDRVAAVDLGEASQPADLALSPDGTELAIALMGAGNIALVDPATLTISGRLYPTASTGGSRPWDVAYSPDGRLYSTSNGVSGNLGLSIDFIHVFDTKTRSAIGASREAFSDAPRLAFAADGRLFVAESSFSTQNLFRYGLDGTILVQLTSTPRSPLTGFDLAVRADGSAVYTASGQVWSSNLQSRIGAFNAQGTRIEYVAATERLFVCQESVVIEIEATGSYDIVATHGVGTTAHVARVNARGTILYVSTDGGLTAIPLGTTPSPSTKP